MIDWIMPVINCSMFFFFGFQAGRRTILKAALESLKNNSNTSNENLLEFEQSESYLNRATRIFHWGSELWPGRRYYDMSVYGFQLGYWTKRAR